MKKYFRAFNSGVQDALIYRTRLLVWFLQALIWISVLPFIWLTVYGGKDTIGGYDRIMMMSYFFFVPLIEATTYFHVDYEIQEDIRNGSIVNFILRPIRYLWYHFFVEIGYKFIGLFPAIITMIAIYPFIKSYITLPTLDPLLWWLIPTILLGIAVGFLISAIIGMVAFWTTRAEWATHLWWMLSTFVGGFLAPLEFYPLWIQKLISYTPFPLLIHTPISILLGTADPTRLPHQLFLALCWVLALGVLASYMYKRGVRRTEGIGI